MTVVAAAVVGSAVVGAYSANRTASSARRAAGIQADAAQAGIDEQGRQFDEVRALLDPYVRAAGTGRRETFDGAAYLRENPDVAASEWRTNPEGHYEMFGRNEGRNRPITVTEGQRGSLDAQLELAGLRGDDAQRAAVSAIENSPQMQALVQQGENGLLQNASATGGLRGGNTQSALAQFRPSVLAALIEQQYARLGGITAMGQNAAAGVGNAGMQTGNNISNLLGQRGAALAGGAFYGDPSAGYANAISQSLGLYAGLSRPSSGVGAGVVSGGSGIKF